MRLHLTVKGSTLLGNFAPLGGDLYNLGVFYLYDSTIGVICRTTLEAIR